MLHQDKWTNLLSFEQYKVWFMSRCTQLYGHYKYGNEIKDYVICTCWFSLIIALTHLLSMCIVVFLVRCSMTHVMILGRKSSPSLCCYPNRSGQIAQANAALSKHAAPCWCIRIHVVCARWVTKFTSSLQIEPGMGCLVWPMIDWAQCWSAGDVW